MIIYYSNNYNKKEIESHKLLERAIAKFTADEAKAKSLIAGLYQCTEYGKPAIKEFNEFSISHSENCWAVLIDDREKTEDAPCGFDIQLIKSKGYETVSEKYYTEAEQSLVASSGKSEFFRLWSRREALVKAVGTTIVNKNLPSVIEDRVEFEGQEWCLQDVIIPGAGEEFCSAICYRDAGKEVACEEVSYVEI